MKRKPSFIGYTRMNQPNQHQMITIPAFEDNYIWLYTNTRTNTGIIVDPGDAVPVLAAVKSLSIQLSAIFVTHHHTDHTAGIDTVREAFPLVPVYGPKGEWIPQVTHRLDQDDTVSIPDFPPFRILY
jgi:hydroxyacylglutathione hydrolase